MKRFAAMLLLGICAYGTQALAQEKVPFSSERAVTQRATTVNVKEISRDYYPKLQLVYPAPGVDANPSDIKNMKDAMEERQQKKAFKFTAEEASPVLGASFMGNAWQGGTPNDNDMAIANNGTIVSVINSTMNIYDRKGDSLKFISLAAFGEKLGFVHSKYDPKVIYDPAEDRFILVFLNGNLDSTSQIILAFSQSSDPTGEWNLYSISGNSLTNGTWTDYPSIGISTHELFIGVNTFTNGSQNNSGFSESCLWQLNKFDGYNGDSLRSRYYHDISKGQKRIFNLMPVSGGAELYGPHMYLVSNRNRDYQNDTTLLYKITGTLDQSSTAMELTRLRSTGVYGLPPRAKQIQTNNSLITNDARILDALYVNNTIHFVGNTRHSQSGLCAVYHGIITDVDDVPQLEMNEIGNEKMDVAFPSIAYAGKDIADDDMIISVNFSSAADFAGTGAYFYSKGGYSELLRIKEGESTINIMTGDDRWGDYSGSQRKYNEPGKVWISSGYGRKIGQGLGSTYFTNGTWIAELYNPHGVVGISENKDTRPRAEVYPNPAHRQEQLHIRFSVKEPSYMTFSVYDMGGRQLTLLLRDKAKPGENMFSFSTASLKPGQYILHISGSNGQLIQEKFVVR